MSMFQLVSSPNNEKNLWEIFPRADRFDVCGKLSVFFRFVSHWKCFSPAKLFHLFIGLCGGELRWCHELKCERQTESTDRVQIRLAKASTANCTIGFEWNLREKNRNWNVKQPSGDFFRLLFSQDNKFMQSARSMSDSSFSCYEFLDALIVARDYWASQLFSHRSSLERESSSRRFIHPRAAHSTDPHKRAIWCSPSHRIKIIFWQHNISDKVQLSPSLPAVFWWRQNKKSHPSVRQFAFVSTDFIPSPSKEPRKMTFVLPPFAPFFFVLLASSTHTCKDLFNQEIYSHHDLLLPATSGHLDGSAST